MTQFHDGEKKIYNTRRLTLHRERFRTDCLLKAGLEDKISSWLKNEIRKRDNYTCQLCVNLGNTVHHIDYNKKNNHPDNLITLCAKCHGETNYDRTHYINIFTTFILLPRRSRWSKGLYK